MHVYLNDDGRPPFADKSRNLCTLRYDLYVGLFDQAKFVIVPKNGQLVVHFLASTHETAQYYHNVHFDHKNTLSHEALYARFAWALMEIVKKIIMRCSKEFNLLKATGADSDGGGGGDEVGGGDQGGSSRGGRRGSGGKRGGGRGRGGGKRKRDSGGNKGGGRGRGGAKRKREDESKDDESREGRA